MAVVRNLRGYVTVERISTDAALSAPNTDNPDQSFGSGDNLRGRVRALVLPEVVHEFIDGQGPNGVAPYPTGRISLSDATFDFIDFSRSLESLGPGPFVFKFVFATSDEPGRSVRERHYAIHGFVRMVGPGSFSPDQEFVRTVTIMPYRRVDGYLNSAGTSYSDGLDASAPEHDDGEGPLLYADIYEGEYVTRGDYPNSKAVDQLRWLKIASGTETE